MPFKLVVRNTDESNAAAETYVFDQDRVTIGREADSDLPLQDYKRVVSKEHAELTKSGAAVFITDLNSKNFTYLNGERLAARRPHEVRPGDTIRIGSYEVRLEITEARPEPAAPEPFAGDRTVFDASFVNPFEDGAQLLAAALRDLNKHYKREAPSRRDDALNDALQAALDGDGIQGLHDVARVLGGTEAASGTALPTPSRPAEAPAAPPAYDWSPPSEPAPPSVPPPAPSGFVPGAAAGADAARVEQLLDATLHVIAQLLPVPWRFRHEFIGQTIMQAEGTAFLHGGEAALKRHLLDPSASDAEAAERLQLFHEAADDVARHLVAVLDGYKAGAQEGAKRLIDQLHPDALVEEAAKRNVLHRMVPPLAKAAALDRLCDQLQELRGEDWASAEQRTYRPAFIKAYLARMTSSR